MELPNTNYSMFNPCLNQYLPWGEEGVGFSTPRGQPLRWALLLLLTGTLTAFSVFKQRFSRAGFLMRKVPGPVNIPFIGIVYMALTIRPGINFLDKAQQFVRKYGPVFGGFVGNSPFVYLSNYKSATAILRSMELDKPVEYGIFKNLVGDGLILSNGDKWKHRRRLITPIVGVNHLAQYAKSFNKHTNILVNILQEEVVKDCAVSRSGNCNLELYIGRCLMDISFECVLGRDVEAQKNKDSEFVDAVQEVFDLNCRRLWKTWLQPDLMWKLSGNLRKENKYLDHIQTFLKRVIEEQRVQRQNSTKKGEGEYLLLDLLLEAVEKGSLEEQDIYDETLTVATAARDTTTRTSVVTLLMLATHPDIQTRVYEELCQVVPPGSDEITVSQAAKLTYLDCCIKEALRFLTVVPFFSRMLSTEVDIGDGIILPKGTNCNILASLVHRDPAYFPDPEVYRPERFFDTSMDPYAFLGFSAGRRNCPGIRFAMATMKVLLAHILRSFEVSSLKPLDQVSFTIDIIQKPLEPILFKLSPRTPTTLSP